MGATASNFGPGRGIGGFIAVVHEGEDQSCMALHAGRTSSRAPVLQGRMVTLEVASVKLVPPFVRRALISAGRSYFAPRAIARREELPACASGVSLHMVVGHDMLQMGLLALRSFEFHTRHRWSPWIHDDGSLTERDFDLLALHFPDSQIVWRSRADQEVPGGLADYPACRDHRLRHHWFLKVFDTRHYAPGERYIILDSDIVFFRRPAAVLDWVEGGADEMWVMEDEREKYSQPRKEIEAALGVPMLERANSGLDLVPKAAARLDLADRFLALCADSARQYAFLEQTIFGLWASAWGRGGLLSREEYEISWNTFRGPRALCRHYIGPSKNDALYVEGAPAFWWQSRRVSRIS